MIIDFNIEEFPSDLSQPYSLAAYTEGTLRLQVDGQTLFDEEGILLVEFYTAFNAWLVNQEVASKEDFIYESSDFEESPIIAFRYKTDTGSYKFDSVWKEQDALISFEDIDSSFRVFREKLSADVLKRSGLELD